MYLDAPYKPFVDGPYCGKTGKYHSYQLMKAGSSGKELPVSFSVFTQPGSNAALAGVVFSVNRPG
jgi:hypothetical protein